MSKIKGGIILFVIFITSVFSAFYFEEHYRRLVRWLYIISSNGKISFVLPKKYLHFASEEFILSFGLFMIVLFFLLYRQTNLQRIYNSILAVTFFCISIIVGCYFGSMFKIVECTACNDGTRIMHYNEINYDPLFAGSLFFAIIPVFVTEIRKYFRLKNKKG